MSTKTKFDFKSIRFKLWGYFMGFSILLLGLIWLLQIFFIDTYYEEMKMQETKKMADHIQSEFRKDQDLTELSRKVYSLSSANDTYIRIETGDGSVLIAPEYNGHIQLYVYSMQVETLRSRLLNSQLNNISMITPSTNDTRMLSYACYLYKASGGSPEENIKNSCIMYMFTPLYPVKSTVSILRAQLVYIVIIAALMAMSMALYLSSRISKPIKRITKSAAEMGKGNYGVQFTGGHYTEITELASTLTKASRALEKTDMYQKDLIANVSHDLRTPLTMIKSYAEMIRDLSGDNPKKRSVHLQVIIDEADRLNTLVTDMLNMSRMQSKKIVLENQVFNLRHTMESLLQSYEILAEQEGYNFIYKCSGPLIIRGDEAKIKQVLSNLINNAVKYCGEDKEIIINLKRVGKKARCEIIDHGAGIAPDEISHVWERYYKSSTHHVRPTDGSGLGLSIVKEILILHNAQYGVMSKLGKGSTFWFEIDLVKTK